MDDATEPVQLTLTPDEADLLKRALKTYFNHQKRTADKYQKTADQNPNVSNSKRAKTLLRRIEDLMAEQDAGAS